MMLHQDLFPVSNCNAFYTKLLVIDLFYKIVKLLFHNHTLHFVNAAAPCAAENACQSVSQPFAFFAFSQLLQTSG